MKDESTLDKIESSNLRILRNDCFPPSGSTLCPLCDYDQRGQPVIDRCPECGIHFDERTRVYRRDSSKKNSYKWLGVISGFLAAIALCMAVYERPNIARSEMWGNTFLLWMGIVFVSQVAYWHRTQLGLVPDGIVIGTFLSRTRLYRWSEIEEIKLRFKKGSAGSIVKPFNGIPKQVPALVRLCDDEESLRSLIQAYSGRSDIVK